MAPPATSPTLFDTTTILSLASTALILAVASALASRYLPSAPLKTRILFIWHAFDSLIHTFLEGGFLYNCFFVYENNPIAGLAGLSNSKYLPNKIYFLGEKSRLYGSAYGTNPLAALWREYAKADARWAEIDLTVVSLELLTVLIGAPLSAYICYLIVQRYNSPATGTAKDKSDAQWFWMIVLATGELYGGFMTFAPEWLTGNPNLATDNWLYMWVYLTFFNMLWVVIPIWILFESYAHLTGQAQDGQRKSGAGGIRKKK